MARLTRTPVPGAPGISSYVDTRDQARYMVRYRKPTGQQTDKQGFRTLRAARTFQATVRVSISKGTFSAEKNKATRLATLWPTFYATKQNLRVKSRDNVESAWKLHVEPRWGHIPVGRINRADVQDWVNELAAELSASRTIDVLGVFNGILKLAVIDGIIPAVPTAGLAKPRKRRKMNRRYLDNTEMLRIAHHLEGQNRAVFLMLVHTGLRWAELAGLRVDQIDLRRRRMTLEETARLYRGAWLYQPTKSHKRRTVPVSSKLVPVLAPLVEGRTSGELLFQGDDGNPIRAPHKLNEKHKPRAASGWLHHACNKAGIPYLSPHDLRHSAASLAVSSGASVLSIQRMLGHESARETLDVYADLFDDDLDDVAERMAAEWDRAEQEGTYLTPPQ